MAIVAQVIGGYKRDRREECIIGYVRVLKMTCLSCVYLCFFLQKRTSFTYVLFQFHVYVLFRCLFCFQTTGTTTNYEQALHNTVVLSDTHNPQPKTNTGH
jgi:hypothetical protein